MLAHRLSAPASDLTPDAGNEPFDAGVRSLAASLALASCLGRRALVAGPVAAAMHGAPADATIACVDLIIPAEDRSAAVKLLRRAGAAPAGIQTAATIVQGREIWGRADDDACLTIAWTLDRLNWTRLHDAGLQRPLANGRVLTAPDKQDLIALLEQSPWPQDVAAAGVLQPATEL